VGAVYLDQTGALLDPDAVGGDISADKTQGGNSIMNGSGNLHSQWDGVLASLGTTASDALVNEARQVPATPGDYHAWPVTARPASYSQAVVRPLQEAQLVKAGRRLADLLNAIWP
jgi:hypothetical protein